MIQKRLKFAENLVPLVLSGEKTTTWRMFDDKNLSVGDKIALVDRGSGQVFANAVIFEVSEKPFRELSDNELAGHEKYRDKTQMLQTYKGYYGDKVNDDTLVKIIKFKLKSK